MSFAPTALSQTGPAPADGAVRLLTRNGLDWTDRMPAMAAAITALGLRTAMLDGTKTEL